MDSTTINSSTSGVEGVAGKAPANTAKGAEGVQSVTVDQSGSSATEPRVLTDEGRLILREIRELGNLFRDAQPDSQSLGRKIKKTRTEDETSADRPSAKPLESDDQSLARRYVETVMFEPNPNPTQSDLARNSGISQSTWSRVFKRISFWQEVDKLYDTLWTAHRVPQNKIEHIMFERGVPTGKGIDGQENTDRNTGRNVVEEKAIARLDRERYAKMDKKQMIRVILERNSTAMTERLAKSTASQLLKVIDRL
jgi:hypothetical protein